MNRFRWNRSRSRPRAFFAPSATLALALLAAPLAGQSAATPDDPISALRAEIAALRADYEARLAALEARLAALDQAAQPEPTAAPSDDVAALRASAQEAAGAAPPLSAPATAPAAGRERNLNALNPEISFTANVLGVATDQGREEFVNQEAELDLQAALDPFSRMRLTAAFGEGGEVDVEELYVHYASLPGGLGLTAGKFRQPFGPLNRQHLHALPQSEYPLVITTFFGEEGLAQTGVSLEWLLPRPWASANELAVQVTDGENEAAFAGESFEQLAVLAHLKSYWDLSDAAYFEWGLSGVAGETADGGDSRVWGSDFTLHWQPPARAKYREVTWRAEVMRAERDDLTGGRLEAWGGYTYLEALVRRNLYLGVRLDRVEDPLDPSRRRSGIVPFLTWWQSEYVRLRAEYQRLEDDLAAEAEDRFVLQLTWAAGPHKHETY